MFQSFHSYMKTNKRTGYSLLEFPNINYIIFFNPEKNICSLFPLE